MIVLRLVHEASEGNCIRDTLPGMRTRAPRLFDVMESPGSYLETLSACLSCGMDLLRIASTKVIFHRAIAQ